MKFTVSADCKLGYVQGTFNPFSTAGLSQPNAGTVQAQGTTILSK
jgi:hypothetical protein